jgi:hypothetical protein
MKSSQTFVKFFTKRFGKEKKNDQIEAKEKEKEKDSENSVQRNMSIGAHSVWSTYWQMDESSHECNSCHLTFDILHRKHHCRACGYIFCMYFF